MTKTGIHHQMDLHFYGSGSDKVYHVAILQKDEDAFEVIFAYGRRGSTLTHGAKTTSPVPLEKAQKIYHKLVAEKAAKGYEVKKGISGRVFSYPPLNEDSTGIPTVNVAAPTQREKAGFQPHGLDPIDESELNFFINSPRHIMQEKKNGERKVAEKTAEGTVRGVNKLGFVTSLMPDVAEAVSKMPNKTAIDGEAIGNVLYAFDMLEHSGKDLRELPYSQRLEMLEKVADGISGILVLPSAKTPEEKKALLAKIESESGEGAVFKHINALYDDRQIKYKLYEECSVVVMGINDKRSVQVGVYDNGRLTFIGNVTIPPNKDIPAINDVIEVRYLYAYRDGCLVQPTFQRPRTDVEPPECGSSQLKYFVPDPASEPLGMCK